MRRRPRLSRGTRPSRAVQLASAPRACVPALSVPTGHVRRRSRAQHILSTYAYGFRYILRIIAKNSGSLRPESGEGAAPLWPARVCSAAGAASTTGGAAPTFGRDANAAGDLPGAMSPRRGCSRAGAAAQELIEPVEPRDLRVDGTRRRRRVGQPGEIGIRHRRWRGWRRWRWLLLLLLRRRQQALCLVAGEF